MVQYYKYIDGEKITYYAVYANRKAVLWNDRLIPYWAEVTVVEK